MNNLKIIGITMVMFTIYASMVAYGVKTDDFSPAQQEAVQITAEYPETEKAVKVWVTGYPDSMSGMPCCNTNQRTQNVESVGVDIPTVVTTIEGLPVPDEISEYLQSELEAAGIEFWYPYAIAQIWAESSCNAAAEGDGGLAKGILQYREAFWPAVCVEHGYPEDTSVFDWKAQISIYVQQTAKRLESGYSIAETVSKHKQSDYGPYDPGYVEYVFSYVRIPNSCDWDAAYDERINNGY